MMKIASRYFSVIRTRICFFYRCDIYIYIYTCNCDISILILSHGTKVKDQTMDFLHADDDTDAVPAETLMAMQEHGKVWASPLVFAGVPSCISFLGNMSRRHFYIAIPCTEVAERENLQNLPSQRCCALT